MYKISALIWNKTWMRRRWMWSVHRHGVQIRQISKESCVSFSFKTENQSMILILNKYFYFVTKLKKKMYKALL